MTLEAELSKILKLVSIHLKKKMEVVGVQRLRLKQKWRSLEFKNDDDLGGHDCLKTEQKILETKALCFVISYQSALNFETDR